MTKVRQGHFTYRTVPPEWRNCEAWPTVSVDQMQPEARARFDRFALAIRTYLHDGSLSVAAANGRCSKQYVIDLLNRCLTLNDKGQIAGWRGLLPYERISLHAYRRRELPRGARAAELGAAGSFQAFLLSHEGIRKRLHDAIRNGGAAKPRTTSRHPSFRSVYSAFLRACEAEGLTPDDYPLNSRSKGRRSVERYALAYIPTDPGAVDTWYGPDARSRMSLGTGKKRFPLAMAPLDLCGADAHEIHCYGVVVVQGPAGPQAVPIERLWIVPVLDLGSRCALRYAVSIRTEISAESIEEALAACSIPWKPRQLIAKGHEYKPGAGFPVGCIDGLTECRPCVLQIDNAAQHYANKLIQSARRALGCAITFGPIGAWWRNGLTERLFKSLEMYGFQCMPSSTGSNPSDALKRDPVKNAVRHEITWEELLDLVDVLFANYNATPHSGIGGQTPLEVMRRGLSAQNPTFIPRPSVPATIHTPLLGVAVEVRNIRGRAKGSSLVPPYVQIDETRYTCAALSERWDRIGQELVVHVRESDMTVWGYLMEGVALGRLECLHPGWAAHRHSRAMRIVINALIRNGKLAGHDPVAEYMAYLTRQTLADIQASPGKVSKAGTQLAEASRITGLNPTETSPEVEPVQHLSRPVPGHIKRPIWRQF